MPYIYFSGSYVGFGALLFLDHARYVALTPLLPTRSPSGDDTDRPALFHAFRAACVLRHKIHEDMLRVTDEKSGLPPIPNRNLPRIQSIPKWPKPENGELKFDIVAVACQPENIRDWNENRFIYQARTVLGIVLVKFTRRYSPELHDFCAKKGHAPSLLGYGTVPGGWNVVVMESIEHEQDRNLNQDAPTHWKTWERDLTSLVSEFHDHGFVHGDLRVANFIFPTNNPGKIFIIDFDWGGKAGEVYFPTWLLNEELVARRMESLLITKEHDIRVLKAALEDLKRIGTASTAPRVPVPFSPFNPSGPSRVPGLPGSLDLPGPSRVRDTPQVQDTSQVRDTSITPGPSKRKRKASSPTQPKSRLKVAGGSTTGRETRSKSKAKAT